MEKRIKIHTSTHWVILKLKVCVWSKRNTALPQHDTQHRMTAKWSLRGMKAKVWVKSLLTPNLCHGALSASTQAAHKYLKYIFPTIWIHTKSFVFQLFSCINKNDVSFKELTSFQSWWVPSMWCRDIFKAERINIAHTGKAVTEGKVGLANLIETTPPGRHGAGQLRWGLRSGTRPPCTDTAPATGAALLGCTPGQRL